MARGESPYQGRYTVPTVDFSPIERGGAAWGKAFGDVGGAIAGGIRKYKLNEQERDVLGSKITGILKTNPEVFADMEEHPELTKISEKAVEGNATLPELRQLVGFIEGRTVGQTQELQALLRTSQIDKLRGDASYLKQSKGRLRDLRKEHSELFDVGGEPMPSFDYPPIPEAPVARPPLFESRDEWLKVLTPGKRAIWSGQQLIDSNQWTARDLEDVERGQISFDALKQAAEYNDQQILADEAAGVTPQTTAELKKLRQTLAANLTQGEIHAKFGPSQTPDFSLNREAFKQSMRTSKLNKKQTKYALMKFDLYKRLDLRLFRGKLTIQELAIKQANAPPDISDQMDATMKTLGHIQQKMIKMPDGSLLNYEDFLIKREQEGATLYPFTKKSGNLNAAGKINAQWEHHSKIFDELLDKMPAQFIEETEVEKAGQPLNEEEFGNLPPEEAVAKAAKQVALIDTSISRLEKEKEDINKPGATRDVPVFSGEWIHSGVVGGGWKRKQTGTEKKKIDINWILTRGRQIDADIARLRNRKVQLQQLDERIKEIRPVPEPAPAPEPEPAPAPPAPPAPEPPPPLPEPPTSDIGLPDWIQTLIRITPEIEQNLGELGREITEVEKKYGYMNADKNAGWMAVLSHVEELALEEAEYGDQSEYFQNPELMEEEILNIAETYNVDFSKEPDAVKRLVDLFGRQFLFTAPEI